MGLFSYALLRGIADSLTCKMGRSLRSTGARAPRRGAPGASCRAMHLQRADLMLRFSTSRCAVLCMLLLIVISIDWYDA